MKRIIVGQVILILLTAALPAAEAARTDGPAPAAAFRVRTPMSEDCFAADPGAGNTDKTVHYNWARNQTLDGLVNNLWRKIVMVYGCSIVSDTQTYQLFGEMSGLIARRANDARCFGGDQGAINTDDAAHERFARTRTRIQARDNLGAKAIAALRCLQEGHNRLDFFATASMILAYAPTRAGHGAHPVCDGRYAIWGVPPVRVGQTFSVTFAAPANRSQTDWVGIFPEGQIPGTSGVLLPWQYVPKGPACGGVVYLKAPTVAGRYYVYYLENNSYKPIGGGVLLTVNP